MAYLCSDEKITLLVAYQFFGVSPTHIECVVDDYNNKYAANKITHEYERAGQR